ncbi:hypothetical protein [Enterovibrio nigricans]|uniref:Uncharacterized protein n=1 Tax=Enterovibrio nigricans DSM 22720 TaxID=1121868 RepID=A0A1T4UWM0_9GAMM|nr:hypothetical protein [Enterovibrio nigricans]PKF50841.1 hypothetical protein AT251_08275 [Enterovibrio nigricans]SKA57109.1 hypothetical protein SAMN02745132_02694 [Enterovibrio nigricans DSM 22720]
MQPNRSKTRSTNSHKFWGLASLRRQRKRKIARAQRHHGNEFNNLQLSGIPLDLNEAAAVTKEENPE